MRLADVPTEALWLVEDLGAIIALDTDHYFLTAFLTDFLASDFENFFGGVGLGLADTLASCHCLALGIHRAYWQWLLDVFFHDHDWSISFFTLNIDKLWTSFLLNKDQLFSDWEGCGGCLQLSEYSQLLMLMW